MNSSTHQTSKQTCNNQQEKLRLLTVPFYMGSNLFGQRGGIVNLTQTQYERLDTYANKWNDQLPPAEKALSTPAPSTPSANPIKYLDLDVEESSFSFKKVMDVWVMNEMKRTLQRSHQQNTLFKWQVCFRKKEQLVKEAYKCLVKKDCHAFMAEAKISFRTISQVCDQVACPVSVRRKLKFEACLRNA